MSVLSCKASDASNDYMAPVVSVEAECAKKATLNEHACMYTSINAH